MDINKYLIKDLDDYYLKGYDYNFDTVYTYNGQRVPRVTKIISEIYGSDKEGLLNFANYMGYKRVSHKDVLNRAGTIGTIIHKALEEYLTTGKYPNYDLYNPWEGMALQNTFYGFLAWWSAMNVQYDKIEIIGLEKELVCPYYGGTADMILNLDGKNILYDFKTSNKVHFEKYFAQLSAYKYALDKYYDMKIHGLSILWLDKKQPVMKEYKVMNTPGQEREYIKNMTKYFLSMLHTFYAVNTINQYNKDIQYTRYLGEIRNE